MLRIALPWQPKVNKGIVSNAKPTSSQVIVVETDQAKESGIIMPPLTGYYSLIQYCPDLAREEAANVGIVLFCPEMGFLKARTASSNDRIKRFFQPIDPDWEQINSMKFSIEGRLRVDKDQFQDLASLERFAATRANSMRLTKPKAVAVEDPEAELNRLFKKLVGGRQRHKKTPKQVQTRLDASLATAEFAPVVRRDLTVPLPLLRRPIKVPYGFQNGRFNLIQSATFEGLGDFQIQRLTGQYAVEGELFHRHRDKVLGDMKLIVVGDFSANQQNVISAVREVLETNQADLYTTQEIPQLMDLIRMTAKPTANFEPVGATDDDDGEEEA